MLPRHPHLFRLAIFGALVGAALLMLPRSAAFAAAVAVYRGDAPAATGPARKIELRLSADGTMSFISDFRNNKPPMTEEGRWIPVSVEQIDLIIERKDGAPIEPATLHFSRQGDMLRSTGETSAQFGGQGLQLRQTKTGAASAATVAVGTTVNTTGTWKWEGLVSAADRVEIEQPERYTLDLQNGGKVLVRADCNRGQGSYKLDGRAIAIKVSTIGKATCPAGSLSERFVAALERAVAQRLRGDNLFIDLGGAGGTMKFARTR